MQRRDFAAAFAALSGADQLPEWPRQGGTSTPAQHVELNGRQLWLVTACKPHDCPSERILVLYDESTHVMSGVFARRKPGVADDVDSNDAANDDLTWLGAPDQAAKGLLLGKLYSSE
nr:Ivy family c-type lysozyme inhibitor [Dyella humicola]